MIAQKNPLLIDLIIESVHEYLTEKDLKSCRLVCSKWFYPATKSLQKVAQAISFGYLYKVNLIRIRPDLETIKLFTSTMSSSEMLPYVKFDLRPSMFAPMSLTFLEEFLMNFGRNMESLSISLAYESADCFPKRCFPHLDLSNLKSLDFSNTIRGELRPSLRTELLTQRYTLLETFLNAAPNLENISMWCDSENRVWPGEAIEVLRKANLPKLRNLKISFPMTNYHLATLSRLNVQLTSFIFLIREPIFNTATFNQILQSQQNTLTSLKIIDLQCDQTKYVELPVMKQLTILEIEGAFYGDNCMLSLFNFSFKKLPKIETIILRNCHSLNFDLEAFLNTSQNQICSTLKELHFTLAHDFVNLNWIREMSKLFPQLKNIHVIFSSESKDLLTSVFQYLKNIEYLTINVRKCGENIDSLLTGIPTNVINEKRLLENCSSLLDNSESSRLKSKPSLLDLIHLKVLEFKGEFRNYKVGYAITDITGILLLQMQNLRNLVFWQTGLNLSEECERALTEKFYMVRIHPYINDLSS